MISIMSIAIALAMDCFAVSIANGITSKQLKVGNALKIALSFGCFQALMPVIGWFAGLNLMILISGIDHWAAFGLLSLIGCKMIYESFKMEHKKKDTDPLNAYLLLVLSVATSIDALAVGLSFAFLRASIVTPVVLIGVVAFLLSLLGVFAGSRFGHFFEKKIEAAGGLILIGIGMKILIEHLA